MHTHVQEWLLQATPDYRMNLIDARHMTKEQIDEYDGDLRAFLLMLQEHFDEEQLKTALATHRETWYALSKIKNDKRYAEYKDSVSDKELEGGIYMDATLDYIEKRGEGAVKMTAPLRLHYKTLFHLYIASICRCSSSVTISIPAAFSAF